MPSAHEPSGRTPFAYQRVARIDARPSDSIALALGNALPIFVARKVLDAAGVSPDSVDEPESTPATTGRPGPI